MSHSFYPEQPLDQPDDSKSWRTCIDCNGTGKVNDESDCCGKSILEGNVCNCCNEECKQADCITCDGNGLVKKLTKAEAQVDNDDDDDDLSYYDYISN